MSKPHKHAEIIKAWADGAKIQYIAQDGLTWIDTDRPGWCERDTYRIKPSIEIPEGFTSWNGGDCPVDPDCFVEVVLRNGRSNKDGAKFFIWDHTGVEYDIIAYKVPVVRWQWILKENDIGLPFVTQCFYVSASEAGEFYSNTTVIGKAEWTRTEFDE